MSENIGKITQVMGPVVDVEFEQGTIAEYPNCPSDLQPGNQRR